MFRRHRGKVNKLMRSFDFDSLQSLTTSIQRLTSMGKGNISLVFATQFQMQENF